MSTMIRYGMVTLLIFMVATWQVLASHTVRMNLQDPVFRGTSGVSFEAGRSNDPWASGQDALWGIYGNYLLDLYGMEFPFSFSISRNLQNYSHPFARFGVTPSFGWAKLHAGISRMQLAGISSAGYEFQGAGVELAPGRFRFSGFYGRIASGNDFGSSTTGEPRVQYSEKAFGAKIGIGDDEKQVNLSVFSREPVTAGQEHLLSSPQGERQAAGIDFGLRLVKGVSVSGGLNLMRTFRNRITWGMETSLGFPAMMEKMNVNLDLFHKSGEKMAESMGSLNMMWRLNNGMLGANFGFSRIDYHDPGYGMSYRSAALNGSLTYGNFGSGLPLNLSLSAAWNRFSQEYGKSSTLGFNLAAGTSLLKSRALNVGASAGYDFFTADQASRNEILLSCNIGYQAGNNLFSSYLNYNRIPGDEVFLITESILKKQNTYRMIAGISWSRSF